MRDIIKDILNDRSKEKNENINKKIELEDKKKLKKMEMVVLVS